MRKPIAMTETPESITVLCDDGTVWYTTASPPPSGTHDWTGHRWEQIANGPIPGTDAATCDKWSPGVGILGFRCMKKRGHSGPHEWEEG